MKIIQSINYTIVKLSQIKTEQQPRISRQEWHEKLQRIMEQVSQGVDTHQAISQEFGDMSAASVEKIKYFVLGALGQDVSNYVVQ